MHGDVPFANKEIGKLLEGLASRERERERKKKGARTHMKFYIRACSRQNPES